MQISSVMAHASLHWMPQMRQHWRREKATVVTKWQFPTQPAGATNQRSVSKNCTYHCFLVTVFRWWGETDNFKHARFGSVDHPLCLCASLQHGTTTPLYTWATYRKIYTLSVVLSASVAQKYYSQKLPSAFWEQLSSTQDFHKLRKLRNKSYMVHKQRCLLITPSNSQ